MLHGNIAVTYIVVSWRAKLTRALIGHTGHALSAGPVTKAAYALVTLAAMLRVLSPLASERAELTLWLGGASWTGAFGLFAAFYGRILVRPHVQSKPQHRSEAGAIA